MSEVLEHLKTEAARNQRLAEQTDTAKRRRTHAHRAKYLQRAVAEIEQMRELMREAIDTIKAFHGPDAWDIYYENAPEMKRFRAAAGEAVPTKDRRPMDRIHELRDKAEKQIEGLCGVERSETEQDTKLCKRCGNEFSVQIGYCTCAGA